MSYFSRLTDIVTCNLSQLLAEAKDPLAAIEAILREMEEGLSGARRSVATAAANEERLSAEIQEHRTQALDWAQKAKDHLVAQSENEARQCLLRKREMEDLVAGLQQHLQSAVATREHLSTMQHALEARLAEALRKRAVLRGEDVGLEARPAAATASLPLSVDRHSQIDAELEALKRELAGGSRG